MTDEPAPPKAAPKSTPRSPHKSLARQVAFRTGLSAESRAAAYLAGCGYAIAARRFKSPVGEVDIVARRGAELLFQIITEREERASIAIGTNLPFSEWGTVFPDPRLVAAIVDRVTFNAHILETGNQSYRLATSTTSGRRKQATQPANPALAR